METRQVVLLLCVVVGVFCAKDKEPGKVTILDSSRTVNPDGSYQFSYLTTDGTFRAETGTVKYTADQKPYIYVKGAYNYIDTNGEMYEVEYESGLRGYQQRIIPPGRMIDYPLMPNIAALVG